MQYATVMLQYASLTYNVTKVTGILCCIGAGSGVCCGWFVASEGRDSTMVSLDATAIDGESGVSEFEIDREDSPSIRFVVHGESTGPDGGDGAAAVESETGGGDE